MLRQVKELNGYKLGARDGEIGHAREFYFEDVNWTVRYLVADTGNWLVGRRVLISPYALDPVRQDDKIIPVELTKKQIENAPATGKREAGLPPVRIGVLLFLRLASILGRHRRCGAT